MKKLLLLAVAVFFFTRCNQSHEQKPGAERANKDTFIRDFLQHFNTKPAAQELYVKFEPKDKDVPRAQSSAIRELLMAMKSQPQRFAVDVGVPNELQGEYGTKISIEPNAFAAEGGKEITSPVSIELKECYAAEEMLEENLITVSAGKILESRGAVFVSATCNGEELKLKEGQKIQIEFPFAVNDRQDYNFYYGEKEGINWTMTEGEKEPVAAKPRINTPEFSYKGYSLKEYLTAQLEYPDEAKRNELSANVEVSFVVDKNGKVKDVSCASAYKTFRDEITSAIQQMPRWKPATYGKKKISAQVKLNIDFNLRRKEQVLVDAGSMMPLTNVSDNSFQDAVYTESFDRLGWISCNRTVEVAATKADVVIGSNENSDVKIVFKNRNIIMNGENCVGYSRFKNLPVGAEVYVVAVRYEGETIFYSVQPLKLEKQTVVSLPWKKGTEEDVKRVFRSVS